MGEREAFIIEEVPNKEWEGCDNTRHRRLLILLFILSLSSLILAMCTAFVFFTKLETITRAQNVSEQIASLHNSEQFDPNDPVFKSSGARFSPQKVAHVFGKTSMLTSGSFAFAHKALLADFSILESSDDASTDETFQLLELDHTNRHISYETDRGVKILPYGIQISHPGIYFVYKSIFFTPYSRDPCSKLGTFKSRLMLNTTAQDSKNKKGTRECLLQSAHTCCPHCRDDRETTFSGGSFRLRKGDVIEVDVSSVDLIDVASDVSFLGLMMIAPET